MFMNTDRHAALMGPKNPEAVLLGQRLQDARGSAFRRTVAYEMGVHENTLGKWERGESVPDFLHLQAIARVLGRPLSYFFGQDGVAEPEQRGSYNAGVPAKMAKVVRRSSTVFVPTFDLKSSANADAFSNESLVVEMQPFTSEFLTQELGIEHDQLVVVRMHGALTKPEINTGDLVLVDLQDKAVATEGPRLVRVDDTMVIKFLHRRPGRIVVSAGSGDVNSFEVPLDDGDGSFEVLGRCRWVGSQLS